MDTFFKNIDELKDLCIELYNRLRVEKSYKLFKDASSIGIPPHSDLEKNLENYNKLFALLNNNPADIKKIEIHPGYLYPIDFTPEKMEVFNTFTSNIDKYKDTIHLELPNNPTWIINPEALKIISDQKQIHWYQPIKCGIKELPILEFPLRLPAAFLASKNLLPKEINLIDEAGNIVDINNLLISNVNELDNLKDDPSSNQSRLMFKYFKQIYGSSKWCNENMWHNFSESSYFNRILADIKTLNKYIPITPIYMDEPHHNNIPILNKLRDLLRDFNLNKDLKISTFLIERRKNPDFGEYTPPNNSVLFDYLKNNLNYAKFLYILKLYIMYKTSDSYTINEISDITYDKENSYSSSKGRKGKNNFETILKVLFNDDIPYDITVKKPFTDNNSISPTYTMGSGNGYLFDELYTLLLLNLPISTSELSLIMFIWNSRIYSEELNYLSATSAPLLSYLDLYIRQWLTREVALQPLKQYKSYEPKYLPLPSIYLITSIHRLHLNKHTHFTNQFKSAILSLFSPDISKNTLEHSIQDSTNIYKSSQELQNSFFKLKECISHKADWFIALFKKSVKQQSLEKVPLYKKDLDQHKQDSLTSIIDQLEELQNILFSDSSLNENDKSQIIEEALEYIYPLLLNYPSDFHHTQESKAQFIFTSCVALYIACNYLLPDKVIGRITLKQKSPTAKDDKNIIKIKDISSLLSNNRGKNCYKLLYPLSSSYSKGDLIPISPELGIVNILDMPSLNIPPTLIKEKTKKGTDTTLAKSLAAFYILLFSSTLYSEDVSLFESDMWWRYHINESDDASYPFKDTKDMLDTYRITK